MSTLHRNISIAWHHLVEYHQIHAIHNKQEYASHQKGSGATSGKKELVDKKGCPPLRIQSGHHRALRTKSRRRDLYLFIKTKILRLNHKINLTVLAYFLFVCCTHSILSPFGRSPAGRQFWHILFSLSLFILQFCLPVRSFSEGRTDFCFHYSTTRRIKTLNKLS